MSMSNFTKRLLLTILGIPLLGLIIFLPFDEHKFIFNILAIIIITLAQREMHNLATKALGESITKLPIILTPIYLGLMLLSESGIITLPLVSTPILLTIALLAITVEEVFRKGADFTNSYRRIVTPLGMLIYPTLLVAPILKFSFGVMAPATPYHLLQFFLLVFANDTGAYVFGLTLGKNNRGIFPPSPKKSLAGLIGGIATSIGIAYLFSWVIFPETLYGGMPPVWFPALLGATIAGASVLGDLFASLLKRAAGVKDSGNFFPGRGGILDTIDSIIVSVPLYTLFMTTLLG